MTRRGRILSEGRPVTEFIDLIIQRDESVGEAHWRGTFQRPAGFKMTDLHGGIGVLELAEGQKADIYLLSHEPSTGQVTFHCQEPPSH